MERKRKQKNDITPFENSLILNHIKTCLRHSIGNIESNFEVKLPLIIMVIQDCINTCNNNYIIKDIIKNIYKELALIIGKDYTKKYKKHDVHKISYCIIITTYELYIKTFPEKLNINSNRFYELFPHFEGYENDEQIKLFNFYKCCVIFKNIIHFSRNFGFIFDSIVFIVEGSNKKYTRGGGANKETRDRSKILFDVYGEVKKPSMRYKKNIFNHDVFSDISSDEESNNQESYDEESSESSSTNDEYICLKKMRIDLTLFDSR
jgi:hypothetical protein